jgi:hypothetical protein
MWRSGQRLRQQSLRRSFIRVGKLNLAREKGAFKVPARLATVTDPRIAMIKV